MCAEHTPAHIALQFVSSQSSPTTPLTDTSHIIPSTAVHVRMGWPLSSLAERGKVSLLTSRWISVYVVRVYIYIWVRSIAHVQHTNDLIANQGEPCVLNCEYLAYLCPAIAHISSSTAVPCLVCVTIPDACMRAC